MDWINILLDEANVSHGVLVLALVISIGILCGKIKVFGISLGITWILFVGLAFGHFGLGINEHILHFMKEFGLILFVYTIGMQVGPSFFSSFKHSGITLNLLATGVVFVGVIVTYILHLVTGLDIATMVGIMSGAVTNTPGLGAAQQTFFDVNRVENQNIALGYAISYPLAVVGIIFSFIIMKYIFKIKMEDEMKSIEANNTSKMTEANVFSLQVTNPSIFGKTVKELTHVIDKEFVLSRIYHNTEGTLEIAKSSSVLVEGDKVLLVTNLKNIDTIAALIGPQIDMTEKEWLKLDAQLISRRISVTNSSINGKTISQLRLRNLYGVNITRVNRAGIDLVPYPHLQLQIADRVNVVGSDASISSVEKVLGNSLKRLRHPNLMPIFIGIALGVMLGTIPFNFPGIPHPVKLGLAGGPLIVAILISKFGPKYKLITYTTVSANLLLREMGISIFLACVGIGAGGNFVDTLINKGGYVWIGYGIIITVVPILVIGFIGRYLCKIDYYTLMGVLSGSMTDPPALSFANTVAGNDIPAVSYATVYPLTMFLRVIAAQILMLLLM